jgi:Ca2+-binding RTX toxin-like protein
MKRLLSGVWRHRARAPGVRPAAEPLETRRLFAVTVTQNYPGFYEVDGDNSANVINLTVSQANHTFTLNGVLYQNVSYVSVYGGDGNDQVVAQSSDGDGSVGCSIVEGNGNDSVTLNFNGAIQVGGGQDTISLQDSFYGEVWTGNGNDQIYVSGKCIDAVIFGGKGFDLIDASQNLYGVTIYAGNGNNIIYGSNYDDVVNVGTGSNIVCCLNGNDTVYIKNGNYDTVYGGGGNDTVYCDTYDSVYYCTAVFRS